LANRPAIDSVASWTPKRGAIDVQMGRTTLHDTNTSEHDTNRHDTVGHDHPIVSWRAGTPCRLLDPDTTRITLSRVVSARGHDGHG
jgi:hypothetical protein